MRLPPSKLLRKQENPRITPITLGPIIVILTILAWFTLTIVPQVHATSLGDPAHSSNKTTLQTLKQQIHVTHNATSNTANSSTTIQPSATLKPLTSSLPAYNNIGISDAANRALANFDGKYRSYSAQALQSAGLIPGASVTSQNISFIWPNVPTGQADNYQSAGQIVPVAAIPGAATIGFLGAADQGSASGTATLTYTDGTTSTFTLGLTDWWKGTARFGNQRVAHFTIINTKNGTRSGNYYLYSATAALDTSKTLQSVTLPTTTSSGQLHIFAVSNLPAYNNVAITDNSNPGSGNFDGNGASYSEEDFTSNTGPGWNPGDTLTYEGINYIWPGVAAGQPDNYIAQGQTIPVSALAGATTIGFVGAADNASPAAFGTATLTYTDGTTSTFTLGFTDWSLDNGGATSIQPGNHYFAALPDYNNAQGTQAGSRYLFEMETPLNASKQLRSITLPSSVNQGRLHVFMIATRKGENYPNNVGTSDDGYRLFANYDGNGNSYSIEALAAANIVEGQTVTFNGVNFTWPISYSVIPNNYQAVGQTIPVTPITNATTLAFLGSATGGPSQGTAKITYTDGSTQTFTLDFSDWTLNSGTKQIETGNTTAATMSYHNTNSGQQTINTYLFYTDVTLQTGKTIQSVTLPKTVNQGALHVFAVGTK